MIYWTLNSVPELKGIEKTEQKRLFKEMFKEGRRRLGNEFWIRVAGLLAIAVALGFLWPLGGLIGGFLLGGGIGLIAVILVQTPSIEKGREWLREQGYPKQP
jgi:hypothetical protein